MTGLPWLYRLVGGLRRPRRPVLGLDVAGEVCALGDGVTRFAVGDRVLGTAPGALAEYVVASEDKLTPWPGALDPARAASLTVSGTTALQALRVSGAAAGDRVLVTGASGGVGSFAVQLAVRLGCDVTAVCSAGKADLVRSLGAREMLDYRADDPWDGRRTFDVVLDIAGRPSVPELRRVLAPRGTAVMVGGEGGGDFSGGMGRLLRALAVSPFTRQRFVPLLNGERIEDLAELARLAGEGAVVAPVGVRVPLHDAVQALEALEEGRVAGKAVVVVEPGARP